MAVIPAVIVTVATPCRQIQLGLKNPTIYHVLRGFGWAAFGFISLEIIVALLPCCSSPFLQLPTPISLQNSRRVPSRSGGPPNINSNRALLPARDSRLAGPGGVNQEKGEYASGTGRADDSSNWLVSTAGYNPARASMYGHGAQVGMPQMPTTIPRQASWGQNYQHSYVPPQPEHPNSLSGRVDQNWGALHQLGNGTILLCLRSLILHKQNHQLPFQRIKGGAGLHQVFEGLALLVLGLHSPTGIQQQLDHIPGTRGTKLHQVLEVNNNKEFSHQPGLSLAEQAHPFEETKSQWTQTAMKDFIAVWWPKVPEEQRKGLRGRIYMCPSPECSGKGPIDKTIAARHFLATHLDSAHANGSPSYSSLSAGESSQPSQEIKILRGRDWDHGGR